MKSSLERTAILARDLDEQPPSPRVVFVAHMGITLAATDVGVDDSQVTVFHGMNLIAKFSKDVTWLMVDRDRIEIITREAQIRRYAETAEAEKALAATLGFGDPIPATEGAKEVAAQMSVPGQYL